MDCFRHQPICFPRTTLERLATDSYKVNLQVLITQTLDCLPKTDGMSLAFPVRIMSPKSCYHDSLAEVSILSVSLPGKKNQGRF